MYLTTVQAFTHIIFYCYVSWLYHIFKSGNFQVWKKLEII